MSFAIGGAHLLRFRVLTAAYVLLMASLALGQEALAGPPDGCPPDRPSGSDASGNAVRGTESRVQQLRAASFPELTHVDLRVRAFHSNYDYFKTRFSLYRFFLPVQMRYFLEVNPDLVARQAPNDGVCSILAHELVHVVSLSHGNRIRRLGLLRLLSNSYTAKFERRTDLEAIHRGYGDGLKSYRIWVYAHIPPQKLKEKKRNYFSPEEIENIQKGLRERPELFAYWSKRVPLNLRDILSVCP